MPTKTSWWNPQLKKALLVHCCHWEPSFHMYQSWHLKLTLYHFLQLKNHRHHMSNLVVFTNQVQVPSHLHRQKGNTVGELISWTHASVGGTKVQRQDWLFCATDQSKRSATARFWSLIMRLKNKNAFMPVHKCIHAEYTNADLWLPRLLLVGGFFR